MKSSSLSESDTLTSKSTMSSNSYTSKSNACAKDAQAKVHYFMSLMHPLKALSLNYLFYAKKILFNVGKYTRT